jgi:hypothetical protein
MEEEGRGKEIIGRGDEIWTVETNERTPIG